MENIDISGQTVIQLNGVEVNVDVIVKDAEIEMNNNDAIKMGEETPISENIQEIEAEEMTNEPKTTDNTGDSTNMNNGKEIHETNKGDSKVDQVAENSTDETVTSESSSTETNMKNDTKNEMESTGMSKSEHLSESKIETNSIEQSNEGEKHNDNTVTEAIPESKNDKQDKDKNSDSNETVKSDSSKKSPQKKQLNKKRKSRSRSEKKTVDYSKFMKYSVDISQRQRRYFLVMTRGRSVPTPTDDCEIFCSNIPINVLEGELIPLFERYGKIWELRLMMSMRNSKRNAGFAFVRFTSNAAAVEATNKLNNYEILPGKHLAIRLSQPNLSLFVGNIHRGLTRDQIHEKISSRTTGLVKTFVKSSLYEDTKNCGFCFLEYDSHSSALKAKRLLNRGNVWGRQLFVDWAQRRQQPNENDLNDSKTLFINYLPKEITEEKIMEMLNSFGTIEKVTRIKDYAFVLFKDHESATDAMNGANKANFGNENVEISLAMPKSMKNRNRNSSFLGYRHSRRNYNHNNSFHRFNTSFGSSNKFFMRKQNKMKASNNTNNIDVGQTQIPMQAMVPNPTETLAN